MGITNSSSFSIRIVRPEDAKELLNIYAPYVRETAITFEYEVPSVQEFTRRIEHTLARYPYLAAVDSSGAIAGYAYASVFHERPAYDWAVETTIYVSKDHRHLGLGRFLYDALETALKAQGILNANACIGYPETEDEYLTKNSAHFHEHLGYHLVGMFHNCGYKFGRWYPMIWMEKELGPHLAAQPPIRLFPEIRNILPWK